METSNFHDISIFNTKLSLALITKKPVEVILTDIDKNISYCKLLCKLTKGSKYTVKSNKLFFVPGILVGGTYDYKCTDEIFNYIISLLFILPFSDKKTCINFTGITDKDNSIDIIRIAYFKMLKIFSIPDLDLVVKKRGFYGQADAQGEVIFTCGTVKELKAIDLNKLEPLEKTRALLISARLNSTYVHDMSTKANELLNSYNFKMFTNIYNRTNSGPAPGFQCTLFSESKNGIFYATKDGGTYKPEEVVEEAVRILFKSICRGGIYDYKLNNLLFILLALSSTSVSCIQVSKLNELNKKTLNLLKDVFNFNYQLKKENGGITFYSYGTGYINYNIKLLF